jgi:chemotaxis protein MotB
MARKKGGHTGGHGWFVTFADLMALLMAFFVMLVAFSSPDQKQMQLVAGSMREAFGVQPIKRKAGMIEKDGVPVREHVKSVALAPEDGSSEYATERHDRHEKQGPEANTYEVEKSDIERPRHFALAAASLRQAWRELPDITELSDNLILEERPDGLHITLVDQDARSMFAAGSAEPFPRTQRILAAMAPSLRALPNRISITGHTDAARSFADPDYTLWDLSADRASAARRILAKAGLPHDRFYQVSGRADSEPLFPENPFLASNRRISIVVMNEAPAFPLDARP